MVVAGAHGAGGAVALGLCGSRWACAGCLSLASGVPSGSSCSRCGVRSAEGRWVLLGSPACLRRPLAVLVFWGGAPL